MNKQSPQSYNGRRTLILYGCVGVIFGACFPLGALVFESVLRGMPLSIATILYFHEENPMLFMIDSAPLWLGIFALIGGLNMVKAKKANVANEKVMLVVQRKNEENESLLNQIEEELALKQDIQKDVETVTGDLMTSSEELSVSMGHLAGYGADVDGEVTSIHGNIEEISAISDSVKEEVTSLDEAAGHMYETMKTTRLMMQDHSTKTTKMTDDIGVLNEGLLSIRKDMGGVKEIVEIINRISENINLLALNATIEASRAGDAGKGFAVVASEIQKLSGQTEEATDNISKMIYGMTNDIRQANDGMKVVNDESALLHTANEEMRDQCLGLEALIREIKNRTENINLQVTDQTLAVTHIRQMAEQLALQSQDLQTYINDSEKVITQTEGHVMTLNKHMGQ